VDAGESQKAAGDALDAAVAAGTIPLQDIVNGWMQQTVGAVPRAMSKAARAFVRQVGKGQLSFAALKRRGAAGDTLAPQFIAFYGHRGATTTYNRFWHNIKGMVVNRARVGARHVMQGEPARDANGASRCRATPRSPPRCSSASSTARSGSRAAAPCARLATPQYPHRTQPYSRTTPVGWPTRQGAAPR
jgi:hypothetical protein